MKKLLSAIICLFVGVILSAQTGSVFPNLEGESLAHGNVRIPRGIKGKHTLIGIALSKKSEDDLKGWFNPLYHHLIEGPAEGSLFAFNYDVNVYFIPMLTGAKRPAYKAVMKKVEKDVDKRLHPHVLFYQGTLKEYKKALNIDDKDEPYFYLLDKEGKIIYATQGEFTQPKMQKIIDQLPFE